MPRPTARQSHGSAPLYPPAFGETKGGIDSSNPPMTLRVSAFLSITLLENPFFTFSSNVTKSAEAAGRIHHLLNGFLLLNGAQLKVCEALAQQKVLTRSYYLVIIPNKKRIMDAFCFLKKEFSFARSTMEAFFGCVGGPSRRNCKKGTLIFRNLDRNQRGFMKDLQ